MTTCTVCARQSNCATFAGHPTCGACVANMVRDFYAGWNGDAAFVVWSGRSILAAWAIRNELHRCDVPAVISVIDDCVEIVTATIYARRAGRAAFAFLSGWDGYSDFESRSGCPDGWDCVEGGGWNGSDDDTDIIG